MSRKNKNNGFYGSCGEFLVAAALCKKMFHVGVLTGNAENVDLVASTRCGAHSVSIQVKSSHNCSRQKRINGKKIKGKYWLVGHIQTACSEDFWYAFVDLKEENATLKDTEIFFVPSKWVAAYTFVMASTPWFFLSDELCSSSACSIDTFAKYMEGKSECPQVPAQMPWAGENEGKRTKDVLSAMELWLQSRKV